MSKNPIAAAMRSEMLEVLEDNILRFWMEKMQDHGRGGFYGRIDGHGVLHPDADKGTILNARILWTFSAAYRVIKEVRGKGPENSQRHTLTQVRESAYLAVATRAKDYFLQHFIDREYGGVYWSLDCEGRPADTKKQFYAIGFAIYGLSEYARATGDEQALDEALALYRCIEEHAWNREHGGYIEAMTRQWQPIGDMRLSEHDANYPKSQNTHLHIIEPYANLLRTVRAFNSGGVTGASVSTVPCDMVARIETSLRTLISIFTDKILNPDTHHLDLFFDMDWTRGAGQLESYGHDIECSWLMHEAALVLGDEDVLRRVEPIVRLVAKASEKGLKADGSMIHETNVDTGAMDDDLHWWVQAEAVVGFYNLYQYFGDSSALDKAQRCWQYIKSQLIDYEQGEWFWSRRSDGTVNRDDDKAGFWKCPYHNGRMCLEIIERYRTV